MTTTQTTEAPSRWFWMCARCKSTVAVSDERQIPAERKPCRCGGSGSFLAKRVKGQFNSERRCDSRCISAKGPLCECECAGQNHGAGWSV